MNYFKLLGIYLFTLFFCPTQEAYTNSNPNQDEIRACWISYIDIEGNLKDLTEEEFILRYRCMLQSLIDNKINTVIVHVRPMGDAIYPSEYFPWSSYICSSQEGLGFDPLKIMIEETHKQGLRFEAWINPYRISLGNDTTDYYKGLSYYELYKDYMIEYNNPSEEVCLSLNPASEQARKLIVQGLVEIVGSYDVDGVHFDDYFYVDGMGENVDIEVRKSNVNLLIMEVYDTIKSIKPDCIFGISPAGNINYARKQGADIDTWLSQEGYIDYIMPQIYWTDNYIISGELVSLYSDTCYKWQEINVLDKTMVVGLALYKVGETSEIDLGWGNNNQNLKRQYEIAKNIGYEGYGLFRYQWIEEPISYTELSNLNSIIDCDVNRIKPEANIFGFVIPIVVVKLFNMLG
ncbi:MAG: glycoside hydrolase family 10 protein [Wujia sp.]